LLAAAFLAGAFRPFSAAGSALLVATAGFTAAFAFLEIGASAGSAALRFVTALEGLEAAGAVAAALRGGMVGGEWCGVVFSMILMSF